MRRDYAVVVCALHAMKPRDAEDNLRRQELLYLITDYMFVAALHFMLDVVGACAGMSQTLQLRKQCVALEDLTVDRCIEAPDRAERWEGEGWASCCSIGRVCVTCLTLLPDLQRASETACVPHLWCLAILNHLRFVLPAIHSGWAANWGCARHAAHHITPFSYFSQGRLDCHEVWNVRVLVGGGQSGHMG